MKKLVKRNLDSIQTVEAYGCSCGCSGSCSCSDSYSGTTSYKYVSNEYYFNIAI